MTRTGEARIKCFSEGSKTCFIYSRQQCLSFGMPTVHPVVMTWYDWSRFTVVVSLFVKCNTQLWQRSSAVYWHKQFEIPRAPDLPRSANTSSSNALRSCNLRIGIYAVQGQYQSIQSSS